MDFGLIENLRKRKKLTQKEFAVKIGFTVTGYQKMINAGDTKVSTIERICSEFNVDILTFFGQYSAKNNLSVVAEESEIYGAPNYKELYYSTLEKLNACNERVIAFTDLKKDTIKKK